MPVHISDITLQNHGPLEKLHIKPGLFTLIYGKNERGKTFLVEFILRSLFRHSREWKLRDSAGTGKIAVSGIDRHNVTFSPGSQKKMEDYWEQQNSGMPANLARLLVVKGAELELASGGIDKAVLKNLLSGMGVLDSIQGEISATLQKARIENHVIIGDKKGELNARTVLQQHLLKINELYAQLDREYSGGRRKLLNDAKKELETHIARLDKAKRGYAWQLSQKINKLKDDLDKIDEEQLRALNSNLMLLNRKTTEIHNKRQSQRAAEQKSLHYEWLRNARDYYREHLNHIPAQPRKIFLLLAALAALAVIPLAVYKMTLPVILMVLAAGLLVFLYLREQGRLSRQVLHHREMAQLNEEFIKRFQQPLSGLPQLEEALKNIETDYNENILLKKQLQENARDLSVLEQDIEGLFIGLTGQSSRPAWQETLKQLENKRKLLLLESNNLDKELAKLSIDPTEYDPAVAEIKYDIKAHLEAARQLEHITQQLTESERALDRLKQAICTATGDDITVPWSLLLQNLQDKRTQLLAEYQEKSAEIIGKIVLMQVLESLRKNEDERIAEGLRSPNILRLLKQVTGRYQELRFEDDHLVTADAYQDFPLSALSTGAREQVMLALRMGFAAKIAQDNQLFLILDDAFQYSDYERRKQLIASVADMALKGWQILYFTMDDHLRDLFEIQGKQFGDQFTRVILP
jgi:hypothetical protein